MSENIIKVNGKNKTISRLNKTEVENIIKKGRIKDKLKVALEFKRLYYKVARQNCALRKKFEELEDYEKHKIVYTKEDKDIGDGIRNSITGRPIGKLLNRGKISKYDLDAYFNTE